MLHTMSRGLRFASSSRASPSRSAVACAKLSTTTSARSTRSANRARSAASARSRMTLRRPRSQTAYPATLPRQGSPPGGSTLITSAPLSASSMPAIGPAIPLVRSTTRIPFKACAIVPLAVRRRAISRRRSLDGFERGEGKHARAGRFYSVLEHHGLDRDHHDGEAKRRPDREVVQVADRPSEEPLVFRGGRVAIGEARQTRNADRLGQKLVHED